MVIKARLLDAAEVIDAYRVFPRLFCGVLLWVIVDMHIWYTNLPAAPFPQWYVGIGWGAIAAVTKFYVDSGRKWGSS